MLYPMTHGRTPDADILSKVFSGINWCNLAENGTRRPFMKKHVYGGPNVATAVSTNQATFPIITILERSFPKQASKQGQSISSQCAHIPALR
eukprot:4764656-Amphidinium_carterae.1